MDAVAVSSAQSTSEPRTERRPDSVEVHAQPVEIPPERFPLKVGLRRETHEKLRYAQDLLGHQVPSGDVAEVLDRALDELIAKLEKRKFAATAGPRACKAHGPASGRYVPASVKRAVRERDRGRCTFVSENGHRCEARRMLEFDHIEPVARGGQSTIDNIRLRCRAHNQYTAERTYGVPFMGRKRDEARQAAQARAARKCALVAEEKETR